MKSSARAPAAAVLAALFVVLGGALESRSATVDSATLAASKSMEAKMQILGRTDTPPASSYPAVVITTHEANSYLVVHSGEFLPAGVGTPSITVEPEHAVAAGDVDFEKAQSLIPQSQRYGTEDPGGDVSWYATRDNRG